MSTKRISVKTEYLLLDLGHFAKSVDEGFLITYKLYIVIGQKLKSMSSKDRNIALKNLRLIGFYKKGGTYQLERRMFNKIT